MATGTQMIPVTAGSQIETVVKTDSRGNRYAFFLRGNYLCCYASIIEACERITLQRAAMVPEDAVLVADAIKMAVEWLGKEHNEAAIDPAANLRRT